jgi:hypothetical protein
VAPGETEAGRPDGNLEAERLRAELLAADPADLITNYAYGLFELARLYLGAEPPRLRDASLAIDALAGLIQATANHLGEQGTLLEQGLRNLQLAFVQLSNLAGTEEGSVGDGATS